jgi:hypothetical protein
LADAIADFKTALEKAHQAEQNLKIKLRDGGWLEGK